MFILNAWYAACSLEELKTHHPLGRTVCGQRMVFFRGADDRVCSVEDFCPHRGAPLSLGRVCKGELVCGYHGLVMGCDGKTVAMPGQRVHAFPAIRAYPVIERYGFIWVWPGQADRADPALMPQLPFLESADWTYGGGQYHIQADYRLMIDNLMDLTHETYVHASSIGQPEIDETPCKTQIDGQLVTTSRFMSGIQAPPFWQRAMQAQGLDPLAKVDRWQICRFSPPSHVLIEVGVALAGQGGIEAPDAVKAHSIVVDFITPETTTSHWYHWGMARRFQVEDRALTLAIRDGQGKIFAEDLDMLERQQANLSREPNRKLLMLNIDAGGVQARRIIDRLIQQEGPAVSANQEMAHAG